MLKLSGKHAFVVLGFELADGEMTDELKARCEAAAAAAKAFPDSSLICSGGATGENNPEGHTEAGLMKDYLTEQCGIAADRILTDEYAMTTAENALNTFAILKAQGIGVFTVDGKMIDIAFYDGAKRTLALARASGVYKGEL